MCFCLGFREGFGDECDIKVKQFGDTNVVFGENELGDEAAFALDRRRRSFYRSVWLQFYWFGLQLSSNIALEVEQLSARRHLRPWTIFCQSLATTGEFDRTVAKVRFK